MITEYNSDKRFNKNFTKMWEEMISNEGELSLPDSFDIVPTLRCNLKCGGCFQDKCRFTASQELRKDKWNKIFDELDVNNKIVKLIGGEVTLHKDYADLLLNLTDKGAYIIFGTNALKPLDEMLITNSNIVEMTTSIDGLARTHDKMRGIQGAFRNVKDFIWRYGNLGLGYKILTTTMVYDNNIKEMPEIMKLKDVLGIERMRFQIPKWSSKEEIDETKRILGNGATLDVSMIPYNYGHADFLIYTYDRFPRNSKGYHIQPEYAIEWNAPDTLNKIIRKNHRCICKYLFRGKINPDGSVNPCFYILNNMGNLKNKSLEDIWNSNEYKKLRMDLANNNLSPICENCCSMKVIA